MTPPAERQTALGVGGNILLAIVVFTAVRALIFADETSGDWLVERIFAGCWFAISMTAWRYSRLPRERRLPHPHAIGVGGLQLVLFVWFVLSVPHAPPPLWMRVIGLGFLALPGAYLIVMGVGAVRAAADTVGPDGG